MSMDFESWRCSIFGTEKFCPPEGCAKVHGCARAHGWDPTQPSPFADPETGRLVPPEWALGDSTVTEADDA